MERRMVEKMTTPLPWECHGEDLIVHRLNLRPESEPQWCVYIAQDDPHAGIGLESVEAIDDLISRLQQARGWLIDQSKKPST